MKLMLLCVVFAALGACPAWSQCTVTIGDGVNLPVVQLEFFLDYLGPQDTICIEPGLYQLTPSAGWPVTIPVNAPGISGADGAEATILVGDGSMEVFLIADNGAGRFSGLTFRSFGDPIVPSLDASLEFTDNIVEYCERGLQVHQPYSMVARNVFRHNIDYGVSIGGVYPTFVDNEVSYNGYGVSVAYAHSIRRNHIHHNTGYGLVSSLGVDGAIVNNLIEENGGAGLRLSSAGASTVTGNIIRGNVVGIRYWRMGDARSATIRSNDLYDNVGYDLRCMGPGLPSSVDVTLNWWGTTDPAQIAEHIYDCNDDPAVLYCASFEPWCEAPGCDGGTPVNACSWGSVKALYR